MLGEQCARAMAELTEYVIRLRTALHVNSKEENNGKHNASPSLPRSREDGDAGCADPSGGRCRRAGEGEELRHLRLGHLLLLHWIPPDKMPIILGHEFTGEVVEVGPIPKSMGLFKPGDRVVVNPVQHCNACYACASGRTNLCSNLYVPGVKPTARSPSMRSPATPGCSSWMTASATQPRVHRAAGVRGLCHEQAGDRTGPVRGHLRPRSDRHHDDADRRAHRRGKVAMIGTATTVWKRPRSGARTTSSTPRMRSRPTT